MKVQHVVREALAFITKNRQFFYQRNLFLKPILTIYTSFVKPEANHKCKCSGQPTFFVNASLTSLYLVFNFIKLIIKLRLIYS